MTKRSIGGVGALLALLLVLPGQKVHGEEASLTENPDLAQAVVTSEAEGVQTLSEVGIYAEGKDNNLSWSIDLNGKLTVNGTGDYSDIYKPNWLRYASAITSAEINTTGMTRVYALFWGCKNLTDVNLSGLDTSKVTEMSMMFCGCTSIKNLDLSSFDTSHVTRMNAMFQYCSNLESVNLSSFDTSHVTGMNYMFEDCSNLESVNLSSFYIPFNTGTAGMFTGCNNLKIINTPRYTGNDIALPASDNWIWRDLDWKETELLPKKLDYSVEIRRYDKGFAAYDGYDFYKNNGEIICKDRFGMPVINEFKCDGTYTYYFQANGTAMKNRLTYHPDGEHVIYFDGNGHEVFSNFANVKKSIAGDAVDDLCFFDVYGYLYVDVVTYDKAGKELYYANPYGVLSKGWFQFSETVKCADGTPWAGAAGGYGYAKDDGTLVTNEWIYDWQGRLCYMQGNGVALYQ